MEVPQLARDDVVHQPVHAHGSFQRLQRLERARDARDLRSDVLLGQQRPCSRVRVIVVVVDGGGRRGESLGERDERCEPALERCRGGREVRLCGFVACFDAAAVGVARDDDCAGDEL